jgi:hypothetical protein
MSNIISPKSGKLIKVGGKTYNELLKDPKYRDTLLRPSSPGALKIKTKVEPSGLPVFSSSSSNNYKINNLPSLPSSPIPPKTKLPPMKSLKSPSSLPALPNSPIQRNQTIYSPPSPSTSLVNVPLPPLPAIPVTSTPSRNLPALKIPIKSAISPPSPAKAVSTLPPLSRPSSPRTTLPPLSRPSSPRTTLPPLSRPSSPRTTLPPLSRPSSPRTTLPPLSRPSSPRTTLPPLSRPSSPRTTLPPLSRPSSPRTTLPPLSRPSSPRTTLPPLRSPSSPRTTSLKTALPPLRSPSSPRPSSPKTTSPRTSSLKTTSLKTTLPLSNPKINKRNFIPTHEVYNLPENKMSEILSMPFYDIPTLEETLKRTKQPAVKAKISKMIEEKRTTEGRGIKTRGWSGRAPTRGRERHQLKAECGNKCFLLPEEEKFPICPSPRVTGGKSKCELDCGGIQSAKIRAAQWKYLDVEAKADILLEKCRRGDLKHFLPSSPKISKSPKVLPSARRGGKMDKHTKKVTWNDEKDCGCGN